MAMWLWIGVALADVAPGCRCDVSGAPVLAGAVMLAAVAALGIGRHR